MTKNVDLWVFHGNLGEQWTFNNVSLERGERLDKEWIREAKTFPWIERVQIPENDNLENTDQCGNSVSLINAATKHLRYQENDKINTVNIYEHSDYTIQAMYIIDRNYMNYNEFNYFASIVNIESAQIYGPAIFFKTENGRTTTLDIGELLCQILNFYYVKTCKLSYGKFSNIAINNFEPEIDNLFKSYHKKKIDSWIILSESQAELDKLLEKDNSLEDFQNLIWLKLKRYNGEIHECMSTTEHDHDSDFRGLYMDVDEKHIRKIFF